jgi:hypothetical protein
MIKIKSHFYRKKFDLNSFKNEVYSHTSNVSFEERFEVKLIYIYIYVNYVTLNGKFN